jgi:hypothetical protein
MAKVNIHDRRSLERAYPPEAFATDAAEIVTAARRVGFRPEDSPGINEPRLRGLRH